MKRFSTTLFPLVVVALLAALTFWLERAANPEDPARKAQKRHDPDFIVGKISIRHFDGTGELRQVLLSHTMTHYPDDDSTLIAKPDLTYYTGQRTTHLVSNTAQVSKDNKQVYLSGDVLLTKPPFDNLPETVMKTSALTVFPDDDIAIGKARVTILRGESVVSGDSINYNGKSSIAILAGRVKGTFYRVKKS
jgi:lipopolysaccharide export system protein LptC